MTYLEAYNIVSGEADYVVDWDELEYAYAMVYDACIRAEAESTRRMQED